MFWLYLKNCSEVGIEGKTNHSLRATGASRLFEANVPEKLIKERTGHRSTDSLRIYERTSVPQQKTVSAIMCSKTVEAYSYAQESAVQAQQSAVSETSSLPKPFQTSNLPNLSMFQNCKDCTINVNFQQ